MSGSVRKVDNYAPVWLDTFLAALLLTRQITIGYGAYGSSLIPHSTSRFISPVQPQPSRWPLYEYEVRVGMPSNNRQVPFLGVGGA